jgi:protein-L-isoaspartate O-methyltransferase
MNENEARYFTAAERMLPDMTTFPIGLLVKSLIVKIRRRTAGRLLDSHTRMMWSRELVCDAEGPAAGVRNYLEHRTIRTLLTRIAQERPIRRACDVGCGYGRLTMVLREFAAEVTGFEREADLVRIARALLPDIRFENVPALTAITDSRPYDLAMTCAVLQHMTDAEARQVCATLRSLAAGGYVLLIEKTEPYLITENTTDPDRFISRARPVSTYEEYMKPFVLLSATDRVVEPTCPNPRPGMCMLFGSGPES